MMPEWMRQTIAHIEAQLDAIVAADAPVPQPLLDAMRYSLLAGGKRVRPLLLLTACGCMGGSDRDAMPYALALEMIHTYSLVHDDLPAMDDDDLRRGRPTCHKVYGEGMAVLAGDGLLSRAFEVMLDAAACAPAAQKQNHVLAAAHIAKGCGVTGMVAGQCVDLEGERRQLEAGPLQDMYENKTGALLRAAVLAGGQIAGARQEQMNSLEQFAHHLGLWFQINDDILDVEADPAVIGKPIGSDVRKGKSTFVGLLGMQDAKALRERHRASALQHLGALGTDAARLGEILAWLCTSAG